MSESRVTVPDRVKEVAKEDFDQAKELARDAIRSAAYLYPIKVCDFPSEQDEMGLQPSTRASPTFALIAHYGSLLPQSSFQPFLSAWA